MQMIWGPYFAKLMKHEVSMQEFIEKEKDLRALGAPFFFRKKVE
jgi:hypothetical protein